MSLLRLWWIPYGETADHGAYVQYPVDDLLAILALESQRHRCMVIGEDLGTVPVEIVGKLRDSGVYSYKVLYFENDHEKPFPRAAGLSGAGDGDQSDDARSSDAARLLGKRRSDAGQNAGALSGRGGPAGAVSPIGNAPSRGCWMRCIAMAACRRRWARGRRCSA